MKPKEGLIVGSRVSRCTILAVSALTATIEAYYFAGNEWLNRPAVEVCVDGINPSQRAWAESFQRKDGRVTMKGDQVRKGGGGTEACSDNGRQGSREHAEVWQTAEGVTTTSVK